MKTRLRPRFFLCAPIMGALLWVKVPPRNVCWQQGSGRRRWHGHRPDWPLSGDRVGAPAKVARLVAANSRRWWHNSAMVLNSVLTIAYFDRLGMPPPTKKSNALPEDLPCRILLLIRKLLSDRNSMIGLIAHPHGPYRLGDFLMDNLTDAKWTDFRASVAFVKKSGTEFIHSGLKGFAKKHNVSISAGVDHGGSSSEGLGQLLDAVGLKGHIWIYKNSANTFHPKVYLFKNGNEADAIIGSGNLTKGGLFENAELGVRLKLDLTRDADLLILQQLESILDIWSTACASICLPLDSGLLAAMVASGDVPTEQQSAGAMKAAKAVLQSGAGKAPSPFGSATVQKAPPLPPSASVQPNSAAGTSSTLPISNAAASPAPAAGAKSAVAPIAPSATMSVQQPASPAYSASASGPSSSTNSGLTFGITLQKTDVGHGQVTAGTSARSPELFIPVGALDANPAFWGWISKSEADSSKYTADVAWRATHAAEVAKIKSLSRPRPVDKLDWQVRINLKGTAGLVEANFGFNPIKTDIRMRADALRGAGDIGDILLIRQAASGATYQYEMEVIRKTAANFNSYLAKLTTAVKPPSRKQYGYF